MARIPQPYLFSWKEMDAASDLDRLRLVLEVLPDEDLVRFLEKNRGKGRDDYPIRPMLNALLAGIVFQHKSAAALIRELWRNGELRSLCGFDPFLGMGAAPTQDAFGRFLALVVRHRKKILEIFHRLLDALAEELPDLGRRLAIDSKAIPSFGKPVSDEEKKQHPDGRRDLDADWGVKTYRGRRADGTAWEKVVKWFGFKLHLLVDSTYELPLAFGVTKASAADSPELPVLLCDHKTKHPRLQQRGEEIAGDKGYDSAENKTTSYDGYGYVPFIDHRQMWKDEPGKPRPLFPERTDVFLYDEMGKVYCQCPAQRRGADEIRELSFVGFEKERMALKYRCPAAHYDSSCPGRKECERLAPKNVGRFGRTVRVPLDFDRRIFTPVSRPTAKWEKGYDRRTAVERVNSRLDRVLGFEEHLIRGMDKMETRVTLALIVMLAMALGRIRANQADLMRSITAPVRRAG